jgi:hypothetical protein
MKRPGPLQSSRRLVFALGLGLAVSRALLAGSLSAQEPSLGDAPERAKSAAPLNLPLPTLGGTQFWGDELLFHGYRIQRHVLTGHCRLLNEHNVRLGWGTLEQVAAKLDAIRHDKQLPPVRGRVILVLHGLGRTRASMDKLCAHLQQPGGLTVLNIGYPSTRAAIDDHAAALGRIIDRLPEAEQIDFVGFSLGNLVVRRLLAMRLAASGGQADRRLRRMVMIAPPNHGSARAEAWAESDLYSTLLGECGYELARHWTDLERKLATPHFEFGIIAGGRGDGQGWSQLLAGDDDGTVSVASTRLAGARDFIVVPQRHTFIMEHRDVLEHAACFLEHGCFDQHRPPEPIP